MQAWKLDVKTNFMMMVTDKKPDIFKHLLKSPSCKNVSDENCSAITDSYHYRFSTFFFQIKIETRASHHLIEA